MCNAVKLRKRVAFLVKSWKSEARDGKPELLRAARQLERLVLAELQAPAETGVRHA